MLDFEDFYMFKKRLKLSHDNTAWSLKEENGDIFGYVFEAPSYEEYSYFKLDIIHRKYDKKESLVVISSDKDKKPILCFPYRLVSSMSTKELYEVLWT